jgi:hypothetical protein
MKQRSHLGDRSAAGWPAGAESLPLLTTKLYRPPVTIQHEQPQGATQKATCCQRTKVHLQYRKTRYGT